MHTEYSEHWYDGTRSTIYDSSSTPNEIDGNPICNTLRSALVECCQSRHRTRTPTEKHQQASTPVSSRFSTNPDLSLCIYTAVELRTLKKGSHLTPQKSNSFDPTEIELI